MYYIIALIEGTLEVMDFLEDYDEAVESLNELRDVHNCEMILTKELYRV